MFWSLVQGAQQLISGVVLENTLWSDTLSKTWGNIILWKKLNLLQYCFWIANARDQGRKTNVWESGLQTSKVFSLYSQVFVACDLPFEANLLNWRLCAFSFSSVHKKIPDSRQCVDITDGNRVCLFIRGAASTCAECAQHKVSWTLWACWSEASRQARHPLKLLWHSYIYYWYVHLQ